MTIKAGFSEIDICPPVGTKKGGWMADLEAQEFLDPLFARAAVFETEKEKIAFLQLDLLSIRWSDTDDIRRRIEKEFSFPGKNIMISATHNHAGPAIARLAPVAKQTEYLELMKEKCVKLFGQALNAALPVEIAQISVKEFDVAFNRRTVMRDGTVKSQTTYSNPDALYQEGPADPEAAVIVVKSLDGQLLGSMFNFACHPTHHGGTNEISAGFPGVLAAKVKTLGIPVCLYLNGAYGNVITVDHQHGISLSKEEAGEKLFDDFQKAYSQMQFSDDIELGVASETIQLNCRDISDDEYHGRVRGAQRYRDDELYEREIDLIKAKILRMKNKQPVEIQVLKLGQWYFAGIPAEYFVEFQLQIKMETYPKLSFVVGGANGMIGYVPTKAAFSRGGYETTLGPPSRMAPETGDIIAQNTINIIRDMD
jgi:Neutral/alkaline non-lysosomal ceramidase, N-terminal